MSNIRAWKCSNGTEYRLLRVGDKFQLERWRHAFGPGCSQFPFGCDAVATLDTFEPHTDNKGNAWLPLPKNMQSPCACCCPVCVKGGDTQHWDTLAWQTAHEEQGKPIYCVIVHYPELHRS